MVVGVHLELALRDRVSEGPRVRLVGLPGCQRLHVDKVVGAPERGVISCDMSREGDKVRDHAVDLSAAVVADGRTPGHGVAEYGFARGVCGPPAVLYSGR